MDGAGVAGGDEVVAGGVLVYAVDVEVVPCVGAVVAGAGLAWVEGENGFWRGLGVVWLVEVRGLLTVGETWSMLNHSNSRSPVLISSSSDGISHVACPKENRGTYLG